MVSTKTVPSLKYLSTPSIQVITDENAEDRKLIAMTLSMVLLEILLQAICN